MANDQYATLGGQRIVSGSICIPYYGLWSSDVVLASTTEIAVKNEIKIANLVMSCHVFRMASFAGARSARLVGGSGGLRKQVASQSYYNPNGVRLSMILGDVSSTVGEKINLKTDKTIGNFWIRESSIAQESFRLLLNDVWWIDEKGIIQCQDRTNFAPITSEFIVNNWSGAKGKFEISTEDISSWIPGRTFTSPTVTEVQKISMTTITVDNDGKLRLDVLSTGHEDV